MSMPPIDATAKGITAALKSRAIREGFDLVGVAESGPAVSADRNRAWLDAGMNGDMAFLQNNAHLRADPALVLDGCRSVVAVAMSYKPETRLSHASMPKGRVWISRYAWGRDYHKIMKKGLIRLGRWLSETIPGSSWRSCVDTAPILEREWAARAGIGWIGKNTMLINRQLGSELFLGLLLTDVVLEADEKARPSCGGCTACLDVCPTGAFVSPQVLDARRCIAYLTIEHRSPIRDEFHRPLGRHAAGCDICNEVCPFTKKAPPSRHIEYRPAAHRLAPKLDDLQSLSEEGWREWRRGSALNRVPFATLSETLRVIGENAEDGLVTTETSAGE